MTMKKHSPQLDQVYKINPRVLDRPLPEKQTVHLLHLDEPDSFYMLDAWAAELWFLIDGKKSVGKLVDRVTKKSKLKAEVVRAESLNLLQKLSSKGLIQTAIN